MVWPEEAGIGAAPASLAKAASDVIRPWCDQERTSCAAACGPTPGCTSSCGASLRVIVSISRASSRSSAVSCSTRRAIERSASMLPRSSGSRRPPGRVAARRCSSRAGVSGRSSLRSGSGAVRGQLSFHHPRAFHGSGVNAGDRPRRAISVHLQDSENRYCAAVDADGTPASYVHDKLVRRLTTGEPDYGDPQICPVVWRRS